MTRIGDLDTLVTIERKSVTVDSTYGTQTITWVPLVYADGSPQVAEKFWANVQDMLPSRSELVEQGMAVARNQTRLRIRWRADVDSSMRVTVHRASGDVVYQIIAGPAEYGGRMNLLEMMLERYSSQGSAL